MILWWSTDLNTDESSDFIITGKVNLTYGQLWFQSWWYAPRYQLPVPLNVREKRSVKMSILYYSWKKKLSCGMI